MKGSQYTLKDLAKALNLSISTVSRALRNHPDVNEDTKKRVQEFAEAVDFQKNPMALSLLKHKTYAIGVVVPEIANYFFSNIIDGIQSVTYEAGYNVLICVSGESMSKEKVITQHLINSRVDGLLVAISAETNHYEHFDLAYRKHIPLVLFDRIAKDIQASTITTNNYEASFEAVKHLIEKGCKRIAHIAGPKTQLITEQRLQGYLDALKKYGQLVDWNLIEYGDYSQQAGRKAMQKLWSINSSSRPDAVFAVNDRVAIGAMRFLKEMHVEIPEKVSVIGFNNNPMGEVIEPALSTVIQPQFEMGVLAAKLMLEQIDQGTEEYTYKHLSLPSKLAIRKSTF
jgi:DNA-binding LacI/PurR family transcriptional regulator